MTDRQPEPFLALLKPAAVRARAQEMLELGIAGKLRHFTVHPERLAACADEVTAELSRRHNDLNVLCLSGDLLSSRSTERLVEIWMETEFEGGRHERRVEKIRQLEKENRT